MVTHHLGDTGRKICDFEASLAYRGISRATLRNFVSGKKKKKVKKKKTLSSWGQHHGSDEDKVSLSRAEVL